MSTVPPGPYGPGAAPPGGTAVRRRWAPVARATAVLGRLAGIGVTPWAAVAVAAASALVLVAGVAVAVLAVLLVLTVAAVDGWLVRHEPSVERSVPPVLSRGIAVPVRITAEQPGARRIAVRQALPPDLTQHVAAIGSTVSSGVGGVEGTLTALRRGAHRLPPVGVRCDGPLGLGRWYHRVGGELRVEVHADLPTAHRLALAVRRGLLRPSGERTRGPLGLGTEFESLREYHTDDDSRLINWRATARLGRPMSNNLRVEQDQTLVIALDCGRLQASALAAAGQAPPTGLDVSATRGLFAVPPWAATRLDALCDAVSALSMVADELGDRCGIVAYDDTVRADLRAARRGSSGVLRTLLDVEASAADADHARGLARADALRPTVLVVLTDANDPVSVEPLVAGLAGVASRRRVIVGVPDDLHDDLREVPDGPLPGGPAEGAGAAPLRVEDLAARALVAEQFRADREAALALVRGTGARVVHAPPQRLAEALVRTYLGARG